MEAHSSRGGKCCPAMEMERPREGSSGSPSRNRERHMIGSPAGTHHSMSTQISRQMTNEDFMVKRVGLGKITTQDASSQLPEMSKGSVGWNVGKNTGQKRMRDRPTLDERAFVKVKPKHPGKDDPLQSHTDKDYIIAKQGQEPELVQKPRSDQ